MGNLYEQFGTLPIEDILKRISDISTGSQQQGKDESHFLNNLLSTRVAGSLAKTTENLGSGLGQSAASLIGAIQSSTKTSATSAKEIEVQITSLTTAISQASTDLKNAGAQSARLALRLNWLTGIIMVAALISAGATFFAARETKRQADLVQQQLQRAEQASHPAANISNLPPQH
jgi:hypothetical protein